jgi:ubiquinone/menaquinone biosynthesis C-methylase UbiE
MPSSDLKLSAFEELSQEYEATVDQELRSAWSIGYADFVRQLLTFADLHGEQRILDLATGTSLLPRSYAAQPGAAQSAGAATVVGLDLTYAVLKIGQEKIRAQNLGQQIQLTCANATDLPFADRSFDCVICALATHHIPHDFLIAQTERVLKPGGKIILADVVASPNWRIPGVKLLLRLAAYLYFLLKVSPARAWIEAQAVTYVHTQEEWTRALLKHNFNEIRVHYPATRSTWAPSAMMIAAKKIKTVSE